MKNKVSEILSLEDSLPRLSRSKSNSERDFQTKTCKFINKKTNDRIDINSLELTRSLEQKESFKFTQDTLVDDTHPAISVDMNTNADYEKLKMKYKECRARERNWRNSYFDLLNESITFDETIKNLIEENRIHQEYIISLENKLSRVLITCNNITSNFHRSLGNSRDRDIQNSINNNVVTSNSNVSFVYPEILNDYKKQLEILSEEKESLNTNLSISRHQHLQTTMKIENLQTRLYNLEQARIEDMKNLELRRDIN